MHLVFSSLVATTLHDNTTCRDNDRFGPKKERVEEIKDEEEWRVATLGLGEGGQQKTCGSELAFQRIACSSQSVQ